MTISYYFFYLKKVQRGINSTNFNKKKNWKKEHFFNLAMLKNQIEIQQSLKKVEKNFSIKYSTFNSFQFHLLKNKIKIQNNISQEIYNFFENCWKSKIPENNYERHNFFQFFVCFLFRQNSFQEQFSNCSIFFSKILKYEIKKITAFHFLFFQKNMFHSISVFKFLATSFVSFPKIKNHQFFLIREREKFVLFCQQNYLETQNEQKLLSFPKLKGNFSFQKHFTKNFFLSSKVEQKNFAFFHFFHKFFRQIKNKQWNSLNFLFFEKNFNTKKKGKFFNCFFPKLQYGNISKYFQNSTQFEKFIDSQEFFKFQTIFNKNFFLSPFQHSQIQSLVFFEKKIKNFFLQFFYEKIFYFSLLWRNFQKLRKENSFQIDLSLMPSIFNAQNNALKLKKNSLCFIAERKQQKAKKHQFFKNHFFYSYSTNEKTPFFFASNKIFQYPKENLIREIYSIQNVKFLLSFQEDISTFQKKKFCIFSPNMNKRKRNSFQGFELFESEGNKNTKYKISYFQNWSLTLFFLWIFFSSPKISSKICFFHSIFCFFLSLHLQIFQKKIFVQKFFKFVQNVGKNFFPFIFETEFFKLKRKISFSSWNISQKISEISKKSSVYNVRFELQQKIESLWSNFLGFPNFSQIFFSFSWKNFQPQTFIDTVYDINILKKYFFSKKETHFSHFSPNFLFLSELTNFCENSAKKERNQNLKTIYKQSNAFNGFFPDFLFLEKFEKNIFHFEKILKFRQKKKIVANPHYLLFFNSEYFEFQKESEKQVFFNFKNLVYKNFSPSFFNVHSDFLFFQKKNNFFRISQLFSEKKMFKKKYVYFFLNFYNLFLIFNCFPSFRILLNTQKIFIFPQNKKSNPKIEKVSEYLKNPTLSIQEKILFQREKNSKILLFFECLKILKFFWKEKFFSFNAFNYKKNIWFIPGKISIFPSKKGIEFFSNISLIFAFFLFIICQNSFFLEKYFLEETPKWNIYSLNREFQRKKRKKREFEIKEKMKLFGIKCSPFFLSSSLKCEKNLKNIFFLKKKPTREVIFDHLSNCKQCIKKAIGQKQFHFMKKLQKIIQSWCTEYKGLGMKEIFSYCDSMLLKFLWNWAKKTHPNKSKYWIRKKYFHQISSNKWCFGKKFGKKFLFLRFHSFIQFFPEFSNITKRKNKFTNQKNHVKFKKNSIEGFYYSIS